MHWGRGAAHRARGFQWYRLHPSIIGMRAKTRDELGIAIYSQCLIGPYIADVVQKPTHSKPVLKRWHYGMKKSQPCLALSLSP